MLKQRINFTYIFNTLLIQKFKIRKLPKSRLKYIKISKCVFFCLFLLSIKKLNFYGNNLIFFPINKQQKKAITILFHFNNFFKLEKFLKNPKKC